MDTHFADTTVVYYKLHQHSLFAEAVKKAVGAGTLTVSNYVRGEYIRGYIIGLIELYFAIEAEKSVNDGIAFFNGLMATRNPRKVANALFSTTTWLVGLEDAADVKKTLRRLGEYIRNALLQFDMSFIRRSRDPLDCEFGIMSFPSETYSEKQILDFYEESAAIRENPECSQCEFRSDTAEKLNKDGVDLDSAAQTRNFPQYQGYQKQAKWIAKARKTTKTKPSCWYCDRLGDSIIALSSPGNLTILSGDGQSFRPWHPFYESRSP